MSDMLVTQNTEPDHTGGATLPRLGDLPTLPSTTPTVAAPDSSPAAPSSDAITPAVPCLGEPATTSAPFPASTPVPPSMPGEFAMPELELDDLPMLPTSAAKDPDTVPDAGGQPSTGPDGEPVHPMAHLMPAKSKPTEASRLAAEARAAKKAKAKRTKIIAIAAALVFSAVVGPPLWSWLSNAINEVGVNADVDE